MLKRYTFFLLLFAVFTFEGFGQAILTFEFSALAGNEVTAASNSNNAGLTASSLSRGSGLTAFANSGRFNATNWAVGSFDMTKYMEFTITPNTGKKFSVSSIFFNIQRSATGFSSLALRSSVDGYTANLDGIKTVVDNTSTQSFTFTFSSADNTTPVTFRLYGIAEATAGSAGIGDGDGNDIIVNGSVADLPIVEPTTSALDAVFSEVSQTGFTLSWTNGNGSGRLVLVKAGSEVDANPADATDYGVNSIFGTGDELGTGNFAVFEGSGSSVAISGLTAGTTYHIAVFEYNGSGASINYKTSIPATGSQSTTPLGLTPPTLTADATLNTVDNNIDITFDNETWRAAITNVNIDGTPLNPLDYDKTIVGTLRLKPSNGNALLKTSGSKSVTVEATGYNVAAVTQDINAGVPTGNSTATIDVALALGADRLITITGRDQYNNLVSSGHIFKYDATITNNNGTTPESYNIDGTNRTSSVTDIALVSATNPSGVATFHVIMPAAVDENDGISVQVQLADGTINVGTAFSFTKLSPSVLAAGDIAILAAQSANPDYLSFILLKSVNPSTVIYITDNGWLSAGGFRANEGTLTWTSPATQLPVGTQINILPASTSVNVGTISAPGNFAVTPTDQVLIYQGSISPYTFITAINIGGAWAANAVDASTSAIPPGLTNGTNCLFITQGNGYYSSSLSGTVATDRSRINNSNSWTISGSAQSVPYYGNTNTVTISNLSQNSNNLTSNVLANITFTGLSNTGTLVVNQYYNPPIGSTGIVETNIGSYRWVINNSGVAFSAATFRFDIFRLPGNGGISENAADIKLYKRSTEGSGSWTLVGTFTYNNNGTPGMLTDDFLTIAGITSFSEFVMASESQPLPVELTSFTARAAGSVVNLNWETATEVDNNGFDVERNSTGTWQKIGFVEGHGTANSPKYYTFTDKSVTGNKIQYRLRQVDNDGTFEYSNVVEVELAPTTFALDQNYPNPFNPATIIRFSLPTASVVTLNVYNTLGEKVVTLLNGAMESGYHQVSFDAANLPSGLYLYEIKAGEFSSIKKMLLMK